MEIDCSTALAPRPPRLRPPLAAATRKMFCLFKKRQTTPQTLCSRRPVAPTNAIGQTPLGKPTGNLHP
eukprot:7203127-Lingulodinium_polyedra.AAC.1